MRRIWLHWSGQWITSDQPGEDEVLQTVTCYSYVGTAYGECQFWHVT